MRAITAQMDADLGELLVEGETHEDRGSIARVAELLANDAGDALARRAGARSAARSSSPAARCATPIRRSSRASREHVDAYYAELDRLGRTDAQIADAARRGREAASRWLRRAALAPLAVAGLRALRDPVLHPAARRAHAAIPTRSRR